MKKMTLPLLALAATVLFSCSKDQVVATQPAVPEYKPTDVKIVSDWVTMNFEQGAMYNPYGLEGSYYFNPTTLYDGGETTQLAFIRTGDQFKALPCTLHVDDADVDLAFMLTHASFIVMANNTDGVGIPNASGLNGQQFRFIVLSNSVINALNIDWTDYTAVAAALDIQD